MSGLVALNDAPEATARETLLLCCGSTRWAERLLALRPFSSLEELLRQAQEVWSELDRDDYLEAFAAHPAIGADRATMRTHFPASGELAESEQAGVRRASADTVNALRAANIAYRERFGFTFIVCATGKSADEMLTLLLKRLLNPAELELGIAAAEQARITELRLERLVS